MRKRVLIIAIVLTILCCLIFLASCGSNKKVQTKTFDNEDLSELTTKVNSWLAANTNYTIKSVVYSMVYDNQGDYPAMKRTDYHYLAYIIYEV